MRKDLYQDLYNQEKTHWWHVAKRELISQLFNRFVRKKNPKILDIGCGTGKNMETLQAFGYTLGIDISKQALVFCRKRGLANVKLAPSHKSGFDKESFDVVTMLDVLEHTDEQQTLKEVYRILKQGGVVVITVPALRWLWSRWDEVLGHKKRYNRKDLEKILKRSGLRMIICSYMYSYLTLPVFLSRQFKSNIFRQKYSSDFAINLPLLNLFLLSLARFERMLVMRGLVPLGTSLMAVAKKYA